MLGNLKQRVGDLRRANPGERFEQFYRQGHRSQSNRALKPLVIALGVALAAIGLLMLVTPGPGVLFLLMGGAILAEESIFVARALDWTELRLRALARRVRRALKRDRATT